MAEVKRKKGETFEGLFRRFQKRVQQSGKLIQAKKIRFHSSDQSKTEKKRSALHRAEKSEKMTYLEKIGKLPKEERPRRPMR